MNKLKTVNKVNLSENSSKENTPNNVVNLTDFKKQKDDVDTLGLFEYEDLAWLCTDKSTFSLCLEALVFVTSDSIKKLFKRTIPKPYN